MGAEYDVGYVIQSLIPESSTCVEPDCYPYLMALDRAGGTQSDGFPIIQSGLISANGRISARDDNTYVIGSAQTRFRETYSYFARQYSLELSPEEDFAGTSSANGRQEIGQKTGISAANILEWVNHVDLMRVRGVGEEYSDLLEAAGVDTVPELAQRNAGNLHQKLASVNQEKNLVRQLPSVKQVTDWVNRAKQLPRVITY